MEKERKRKTKEVKGEVVSREGGGVKSGRQKDLFYK